MVMPRTSDAASMSRAPNRPSMAQRHRFSRSIASEHRKRAVLPLPGYLLLHAARQRFGRLLRGASQTTFDTPPRSEIPTSIACRTNLAHAPVPVPEGCWRQDVDEPAHNFGANIRAQAEFTVRAANGSLPRTVNPAARMASTMSFAIRVRPCPRNAPVSQPATDVVIAGKSPAKHVLGIVNQADRGAHIDTSPLFRSDHKHVDRRGFEVPTMNGCREAERSRSKSRTSWRTIATDTPPIHWA